MSLERFIKALNNAETVERAFEVFCSAMQHYGYDQVSYTLCTDHPSLGLPKQHGLSTSYPEDWMKFYNEKKYIKIDPVVDATLNLRRPFFWDHITAQQDKSSTAFKLMKDAEDAGLANGVCVPISTPYGELTGIGVAKSKRDNNDDYDYDMLARINLLSLCFHEVYRSLITKPVQVHLTLKEKDVLSWAAEGKMDEDIALLMNISFSTVRFHWNNIFHKLDSFNKVHAVSKALRLKLITPGTITY